MNKARFTAPSAIILGDPDIGEGTWIGHFCVIDGSQGLVIGRNCSIASGVHIYTHSTHELTTEGKPKLVGRVKIGNNVAIGANSVILHGCEIGDNVVVPALTLLRPWTRISKVFHPEISVSLVNDELMQSSNCHNLGNKECPSANASDCISRVNRLPCPTFTKEELGKMKQ